MNAGESCSWLKQHYEPGLRDTIHLEDLEDHAFAFGIPPSEVRSWPDRGQIVPDRDCLLDPKKRNSDSAAGWAAGQTMLAPKQIYARIVLLDAKAGSATGCAFGQRFPRGRGHGDDR